MSVALPLLGTLSTTICESQNNVLPQDLVSSHGDRKQSIALIRRIFLPSPVQRPSKAGLVSNLFGPGYQLLTRDDLAQPLEIQHFGFPDHSPA